jgi:hypothetical protein
MTSYIVLMSGGLEIETYVTGVGSIAARAKNR